MGQSTSETVGDMFQGGLLLKDAHATLVGGDDVSHTAEELADHIGEKHEVVGEAVEKLAETAGKLIDATIGTDGLGAAAKWAVKGVENVVLSPVQDVSRVVAEHGSEAAHTVARKVLKATGGTADGMPDVQPSSVDLDLSELGANAEHAVGEAVEKLADSAGKFIGGTIGTDSPGAAAKWAVERVEDAALGPAQDVSRAAAERGSEVAHNVTRRVLEANEGERAPGGMPDAEHSSLDVNLARVETTAEEAADSAGLGEAASSELVEATLEAVTDEVASEIAEAALDAVPIVGQCLSAWKIVRSTTTATVGVGALAVSASFAAAGCVTTDKRTKQAAIKTARWGASVTGEGACMAAKGAINMTNVVPGAQVATFPLSVVLGLASSRCARARINSA